MSRGLWSRMLSKTFHLDGMTNYDGLSQMRFTKKHTRDIASLIPWRETTILGQVRIARRRYCASKEEALCVLIARLAMPSRVEDLEKRFFRSKAAIVVPRYFLRRNGPSDSEVETVDVTTPLGCHALTRRPGRSVRKTDR
jgi:hypothetical protein